MHCTLFKERLDSPVAKSPVSTADQFSHRTHVRTAEEDSALREVVLWNTGTCNWYKVALQLAAHTAGLKEVHSRSAFDCSCRWAT